MLDPKLLRSDLENTAARLALRGFRLDTKRLAELEEKRKAKQVHTQQLQNKLNATSTEVGRVKAMGQDTGPLKEEATDLGDRKKMAEAELEEIQACLNAELLMIPNLPHASVPEGKDENDNAEIRRWGEPRKFNFPPKDHADLGAALGLDFETAAKITGARFSLMSGPLARMHRALIQFMLDVHTQEHGYVETYVPYIVNADSLRGTGQLPKLAADLFALKEQEYYLIPTAEVPLTNIVRDMILEANSLPRKYVAHTPCFRSEAGSYGKDTRGMIR